MCERRIFMRIVFDELYDHYHQDLYRFIFYMVKDQHVTEDLVQETYIKVLQSYKSFRGESSKKTWLFSIARHVVIDHFRQQKRQRNRILQFFNWSEQGESLKDESPTPVEITFQNEELKEIYQYLDHCTIDQRNVLILRFIQSFSIRETAEILNFSISKVKTTQHRGLKHLRKLMA